MRTLKTTLVLLAVFLLIAPAPAQAWWGWLEELSGPGRFWGAEFDFRLVCLMQQAPWADAIVEAQIALELLRPLNMKPDGDQNSSDYKRIFGQLDQLTGPRVAPPVPLLPRDRVPTTVPPQAVDSATQFQREIGTAQGALNLAAGAQPLVDQLKGLIDRSSTPTDDLTRLRAVHAALARASSSLRASAVPRVSKLPGGVAWSSCTDRSASGEPALANAKIQHQDRHEVLSVVLNYREYWNSDYLNWGHATNDNYAGGEIIHLRIIEPKISWPMSGRLDVLDGQAGIGLYSFSSKGMPGTVVGMIVEPIRFDLHFPSKLADAQRNFFARLPLALSFRAGVVLFPAGFAPDVFNAKATAARRITGGEALFEYGIVVNVGRLFQ